jgi:hypothetical protein
MLGSVGLVDQWKGIESGLDPSWVEARLALQLDDDSSGDRATALLGPANPGRFGRTVRFAAARRGDGVGPEAIRRMLRRIDEEGIGGSLELVSTESAAAPEAAHAGLAPAWEEAVGRLPEDWSDLLAELDLTSTDHIEPAALRLVPINPALTDGGASFRFRVARRFGYGGSPQMVRRCLERLDEAGIPGRVRIVRAFSDTRPVATQGPVWYVGGKVI